MMPDSDPSWRLMENRLTANPADGIAYSYGPDNRRVRDGAEYKFWSVSRRPIGRYRPVLKGTALACATAETKLWFGGRLIRKGAGTGGTAYMAVVVDRLGPVRVRGSERHAYWPYGQERTPTAQGRMKFGTYLRDTSGLDYADQRHFAWQWGRFMTADPAPGMRRLKRRRSPRHLVPITRPHKSGPQPSGKARNGLRGLMSGRNCDIYLPPREGCA